MKDPWHRFHFWTNGPCQICGHGGLVPHLFYWSYQSWGLLQIIFCFVADLPRGSAFSYHQPCDVCYMKALPHGLQWLPRIVRAAYSCLAFSSVFTIFKLSSFPRLSSHHSDHSFTVVDPASRSGLTPSFNKISN